MIHFCFYKLVLLVTILHYFTILETASTTPLGNRLRHFINLTNGIEAIPMLKDNGIDEKDLNYVRIQSTHCESRNYNAILESLDTTLLMNLARGNVCLIYDFGSRGTGTLIGENDARFGIPRAYWMGTEWIRHALASIWRLPEADMGRRFVRGYNSVNHFDEQVMAIPKTLRRRLKYFRPFVTTRNLYLYPIYMKTVHDGNQQFYVDTMASIRSPHAASDDGEEDSAVVDDYIQNHFIPSVCPGMRLYRSEDFMGLGRAPLHD